MSTDVYTGVWTNWSQGPVTGATLTLTSRSGGLLTAFLALFVTVVGSQLWRLLCYVVHQIGSNPSRGHKDFLQRQVILRNSATPSTGSWAFLVHGFQGRKHTRFSLIRALPWVLVSALFSVFFAVAAIFSSNISKLMSDARLVKSDVCGDWSLDRGWNEETANWLNETFTAASYARACYGGLPNNPQCSRMPVQQITHTQDQNASCPFETGACVWGETAALSLESRMIDSQADLGLNTPKENRIQYQMLKTCAPIHTSGHILTYNATVNDTVGIVGERLSEYQFGPIAHGAGRYPNLTTYVTGEHSYYGNAGFILTVYSALADAGVDNVWTPIPALNRMDADISIFFLEANTMRFASTNNDPLFGAHTPARNRDDVFFSDYDVTAMACAEQSRICNPDNGLCTPYLGSYQLIDYVVSNYRDLRLEEGQVATISRVLMAAARITLADQVDSRRASALRITETTFGPVQPSVPDDQWMIEVGSWFDTALARLQLRILQFATGPTDPDFAQYIERPAANSTLLQFCGNQIVHDASRTTSFSILGLAIVFIIGGVIILLNQLVEPVVGMIQKHSGTGDDKRKRWIADDVMELHSSALDSRRNSEVTSFLVHKESHSSYEGSGQAPTTYSVVPTSPYNTYGRVQSMPPREVVDAVFKQ